jgi:alpha-beta hydrolase superfamily lysophospholipase
MKSDTLTVRGADGIELHTYRWLPSGRDRKLRAIVQVSHGMAEHAGRYERFAKALTKAGYGVYANDHRGHGLTASTQDHGYLADNGGFDLVVEDMGAVTRAIRSEHPDLPVILFGHSMGSFLARLYAARHVAPIDALILSGTAGDPGPLGLVGRGLAAAQARLRGKRHPSGLLDNLAFGQNNNAFKPARTEFDWLSRDEAEVDAYVADPLCGNVFTAGFYQDLLAGLAEAVKPETAASVSNDLPILLFSGDQDPVGDNGKAVVATADQYRTGGSDDLTCKLYPEGRHEMLNEINRDDVMADIVHWLNGRFG